MKFINTFCYKLFFDLFSIGSKKTIHKSKNLVKNYVMLLKEWELLLLNLGQFLATRPDIIGEDIS